MPFVLLTPLPLVGTFTSPPEFPLFSLFCHLSLLISLPSSQGLFASSRFRVRRASERKESLIGAFYVPSSARLLLLLLSALEVLSLESGLKQSQSSRDLGRLFSFVTSTFGFRRISYLTSLFDFSVIFTRPSIHTHTHTRPPLTTEAPYRSPLTLTTLPESGPV